MTNHGWHPWGSLRVRLGLALFSLIALALAACGGAGSTPTPTATSSATSASTPTSSPTSSTQSVTLKMITAWSPGTALADVGDATFMAKVKEISNGKLVISRAGGPESVPTNQQFTAVQSGLFDVLSTTGAYHPDVTTLAQSWNIVPATIAQRQSCGMVKPLVDFYQTVGMHFLGQISYQVGERVYTSKAVDPATGLLTGMQLRAAGTVDGNWVKALGGTPVTMAIGDVYDALNRGLVDGLVVGGGAQLAYQFSWYEVAKYAIAQSIGWTGGEYLVNQDTWNKLSPDLQNDLAQSIVQTDSAIASQMKDLDQSSLQKMQAAGMQITTLSDAAVQKWTDNYYNIGFDQLSQSNPAQYVDALKTAAACVRSQS